MKIISKYQIKLKYKHEDFFFFVRPSEFIGTVHEEMNHSRLLLFIAFISGKYTNIYITKCDFIYFICFKLIFQKFFLPLCACCFFSNKNMGYVKNTGIQSERSSQVSKDFKVDLGIC